MVIETVTVPPRDSRVNPKPLQLSTKTRVATKRNKQQRDHHPTVVDGGNKIKCSGDQCSSCTATIVADCIAVCCCPCAIINLVILAFVKVPLLLGRKFWRLMRNKGRKRMKEKGRDGRVIEGICNEKVEISRIGEGNFCPSDEAERVWLELYEVGHLGFGRVSIEERGN
ncbi:hypothetical protein GIB67_004322 [Kingdonia uniflora]|uniref:Uncharacterized protein n=1 Tax=Kingdonia uniflora TaxID=39325 RepID=A0A7J7MRB3_9MAGN|nr:hypothetical protein GIB67_004322 [Kingdonia uniflora]